MKRFLARQQNRTSVARHTVKKGLRGDFRDNLLDVALPGEFPNVWYQQKLSLVFVSIIRKIKTSRVSYALIAEPEVPPSAKECLDALWILVDAMDAMGKCLLPKSTSHFRSATDTLGGLLLSIFTSIPEMFLCPRAYYRCSWTRLPSCFLKRRMRPI